MSIIISSLHQIYWNDQIKKYEKGRTHRCLVEKINARKCIVRHSEEKRQLARHRCRIRTNIKGDLKEMRCAGVEWIKDPPQKVNRWAKGDTVIFGEFY
jgi:hypothetical protein